MSYNFENLVPDILTGKIKRIKYDNKIYRITLIEVNNENDEDKYMLI